MGCWNESCMLTDLPIDSGEKIGTVLIAKISNENRHTDPHDVWTPISPILYGKYDDYGGIRDIQPMKTPYMTAIAAMDAGRIHPVGFYNSQEKRVIYDQLSDLLSDAERGNVFLNAPGTNGKTIFQPVSIAHMKQNFVQMALEFPEAKEMSILPDTLPAFSMRHPFLRLCNQCGIDITEVYRLDIALQMLRRSWQPVSGCGSQTMIERQEVVEWYKAVSQEANYIYLGNRWDSL